MTDKQQWISDKISKLMKEGKYSHEQSIAIAFSLWNDRPKAQFGMTVPPFEDSLAGNPMQGYYTQPTTDYNRVDPTMYNNYQALPQQGVNLDINNLNTPTNIPDQELSQRMAQNKANNTATNNYDENGNAINTNSPTYEDYMRLKLANPYTGVDLESSLFFAGQGFGKGNIKEGLLGTATAGLKGARTFMSGMGAGKSNSQTEAEMLRKLYQQPNYEYGQTGSNANYIYQEGGKLPTNAEMLTGNYITNMPQSNVNIEDGEHTKNSQTGDIQEAKGEKHSKGGIDVNLPAESKVLSDFTKIGAQNAKKFKEQFGVDVKASHTFSDVMDKVNKKIGITKLIEEEKEYTTKIEKQLKSSINEATKKVNLNFLAKEIEELQKEKDSVKVVQDQVFEELFKEQEKIPKNGKVEMQDGGETPQQGVDIEQIIQAFAQVTQQDPQVVMQQLQGMSPEEQQQAFQEMMQVVQQQSPQEEQAEGAKSNPQEEGMEVMQNGGYTFSTRYIPSLKDYTTEGKSILNQDTLDNVEAMQPYTGKGYGAKMASVEDTIKLHDWYFTDEKKKEAFRQAVLKKGEQPEVKDFQTAYNKELEKRAEKAGIPKEDVANVIKQVGFSNEGVQKLDGLFGAFTSTRPLYTISKKDNAVEVKPTEKSQEVLKTEQRKTPREVVKTVSADLPVDFLLPPGALESVYKPGINLSRLDPIKISPESNLAQIEGQRQATTESLNFLPENQRAAVMANMLGTTQASANQAIGQTTQANTATQMQVDQYNAGQSDKEQLMNIELAKDYERKMLGAKRNTDIDLRRFYNQLNMQNRQNYMDVNNLNLSNAMTPNYQTTGSDIVFNNAPLNMNKAVVDPYTQYMFESTKDDPQARIKFMQDLYKSRQT